MISTVAAAAPQQEEGRPAQLPPTVQAPRPQPPLLQPLTPRPPLQLPRPRLTSRPMPNYELRHQRILTGVPPMQTPATTRAWYRQNLLREEAAW